MCQLWSPLVLNQEKSLKRRTGSPAVVHTWVTDEGSGRVCCGWCGCGRRRCGGEGGIGGDTVVLALGSWTSMLTELSSRFRVCGKEHSIALEPKDGDAITPHATGEVYICEPSVEAEIPEGPDLVSPYPKSTQLLKKVAGITEAVPGMSKCYVASGHGYWGILFGPATADLM